MNLIVAVDKRYGIGKDGGLLTHLPKDLKQFSEKTTNNIVLMGRKTIDSLPKGKLLPNRETWILTRNKTYVKEGALIFNSVEEVFDYIKANQIDSNRIFVAGGRAIYNTFLPYVEKAYITKIDFDFTADVHMDNVDDLPYMTLKHVSEDFEHKGYVYKFCEYENRHNKR